MEEVWKSIEGYEGDYEVSNTGKVRSSKGKKTHSEKHGIRHWEQREMKLKTDKGGYKRVSLWKDKRPSDFLVHRLVALMFCEKKDNKNIVNHLDGNPSNNHYLNLEWCDHKGNNNHAFDNRLIKTSHEIILFNKKTSEILKFRSKAKASLFLGKPHSFISSLTKKGVKEYKDYEIRCNN